MDAAPLSTFDILTRCIIKVNRDFTSFSRKIFQKTVDMIPPNMVLFLSFKGTDARV